ncbi:histidinol-phosphate transaminase [Christensenella minuta]|uniref:histidinol-phosphate transaminase n=1 Tax=Christensenella minuta TaxID=626937 RepID=UPI002A7FF177|nr:histidinol-phosphate transaminase [Christensenella minuta]MDY3750672.1 histidinol-phosphate transaminase [Christensenella minuta]
MKEFWSEKAKSLTPYTAGEQPRGKMVKLNTNENAYPPSPAVAEAVRRAAEALRLYPDPDARSLCVAIAEYHGVRPQQVFCANGSDEALALCCAAFFQNGTNGADGWFPGVSIPRRVKTPDVGYSFYPVWAELFDVPLEMVPLKEDYSVDVEKMYGGCGMILANPNAPTGVALSISNIEKIIQRTNGVAVVDEAYASFSRATAVPLIDQYRNLAVVRTLSKSHSLAGLRVGYVVADENLIAALRTVKDSFNSYPLDALAQAGAEAAVRDAGYCRKVTEKILKTRAYMVSELEKLGILTLPSEANFVFARFDGPSAEAVFTALRERGVLVRWFSGRRTRDFLRITIGTREEMDTLLSALKEILCK